MMVDLTYTQSQFSKLTNFNEMKNKKIEEWLDKTDPEGLSNRDGCSMAVICFFIVIISVAALVIAVL